MQQKPIQYQGLVTTINAISHGGGEIYGNSSMFRRESIQLPAMTGFVNIPVISGNSLRSALRRHGGRHLAYLLGYGEPDEHGVPRGFPLAAHQMLFSGGSLGGKATRGLNIDFARLLRELIPLLSVLGTASGNQIESGRCNIGKMIPICRETAHIIPPLWLWKASRPFRQVIRETFGQNIQPHEFVAVWCALLGKPHEENGIALPDDEDTRYDLYQKCVKELLSVRTMMQEVTHVRGDSAKNKELEHLLTADARKLLEVERTEKLAKAGLPQDDTGRNQQMIYSHEVLSAGTQMYWQIVLYPTITEIEFEAFWAAMGAWGQMPYVGGKQATGFAEIAVRFSDWVTLDSRANIDTSAIDRPLGSKYIAHIEERRDEIRAFLEGIQ